MTHKTGMNWVGLAALAWDPSGGDDPQHDYAYFKTLIEQNDTPALDVGCGTGRLLLRYLADGLDVDGIDTSPDMLALCREKAARRGVTPTLYQQAMQQLDLPRKYRVIYIPCGTFCLMIDRAQAVEALHRFYDHLEPGGVLVFNLFWVFAPSEPLSDDPLGADVEWKLFYRGRLPDGRELVQYARQPADGEWKLFHKDTLPDGRELAQHMRRIRVDRVEQVLMMERRYQLYENGALVQEEIFPAHERWYFKYEMLALLEKTGFRDIQVKGDYGDADFKEGHSVIFFIARK